MFGNKILGFKNHITTGIELGVLFIITIMNSLFFSPLFKGWQYDVEVFRYCGMLLRNGGILYKDVFEHKPPIMYYLSASVHSFGPWGLWGLGTLFIFIGAWGLLLLSKKIITKSIHPITIPILFILLILSNNFGKYELVGMSRQICACMILIFLLVNLICKRNLSFLNGILVGIIFFTQTNEVMGLIPVVVYLIWKQSSLDNKFNPIGIFKTGNLYALGIICVIVPFIIYLNSKGAFADFYYQLIEFNRKSYMVHTSMTYKMFETIKALLRNKLFFVIMALFIIEVLVFIKKKRINLLILSVSVSIIFQFISTALVGQLYEHYFLIFIPYLVVLLVLLIVEMQGIYTLGNHKLIGSIFLILACLSLTNDVSKIDFIKSNPNLHYCHLPEYDTFLDVKGKRGQLFVFRNTSLLVLNTDLNIISPSKWIYTHFYEMIPGWDKDEVVFHSIEADLISNKCKYIVDFSPSNPVPNDKIQSEWKLFTEEHYETIKDNTSYRILKYKGSEK